MDCSKLNEVFNCDGIDRIELKEYDPLIPYESEAEQKSAWYYRNRERLLREKREYTEANREEINRKRREKRSTEPYRSHYLSLQRKRRLNVAC